MSKGRGERKNPPGRLGAGQVKRGRKSRKIFIFVFGFFPAGSPPFREKKSGNQRERWPAPGQEVGRGVVRGAFGSPFISSNQRKPAMAAAAIPPPPKPDAQREGGRSVPATRSPPRKAPTHVLKRSIVRGLIQTSPPITPKEFQTVRAQRPSGTAITAELGGQPVSVPCSTISGSWTSFPPCVKAKWGPGPRHGDPGLGSGQRPLGF